MTFLKRTLAKGSINTNRSLHDNTIKIEDSIGEGVIIHWGRMEIGFTVSNFLMFAQEMASVSLNTPDGSLKERIPIKFNLDEHTNVTVHFDEKVALQINNITVRMSYNEFPHFIKLIVSANRELQEMKETNEEI